MPPDRRFGLPHPLDDDPSEGSNREKKGFWGVLKRALGADAPSRPDPPSPEIESQAPPLPAAPRTETPPITVPVSPAAEPRVSASTEVPFLDEAPGTDPPPGAAPGTPRLARGLASFSKSNAEREKRFSHILRDEPSAKKSRRR